ncbi:CpaF family protein, partial [Rothia mucilaginosa]
MENTVLDTRAEHLTLLEENIREAMRHRSLDPHEDQRAVRGLIDEHLNDYEQRRTRISLPDLGDRESVIQRLHDEICGFGVIQPFLDDESVEEIWINSPDEIFIARNGESELTGLHLSAEAINSLLERMLKPSGRRVDLSSPFVDASLPDGSRLHAVIPDITRRHTSINIRKFVVRARRLPDLVRMNSLSAGAASLLHAAVESGMNILVSGATQAGKTTMLNCLSASIPPRERVITCEEIFELA